MGFWNEDTFDPRDPRGTTDPGNPCVDPVIDVPTTGYGYRLQLFGGIGGDLMCQPNWQYFQLDPAFDDPNVDHNNDGRVGNGDGLVTAVDVGPGWHTYTATIEENKVTMELDLFRDGTIDSTEEWDVTTNTGAPYTSLRMGGPSGVSINEFSMADNVRLETISIMPPSVDGDFNDDGTYDCMDVDPLVAEIAAGTDNPDFDLNGDTFVDTTDLDLWLAEAGANELPSGNPYLPGDADLNGSVDGADFIEWNDNKFTLTAAWCSGDFNADGSVDGADFIEWNDNKFTSSDVAVPEAG